MSAIKVYGGPGTLGTLPNPGTTTDGHTISTVAPASWVFHAGKAAGQMALGTDGRLVLSNFDTTLGLNSYFPAGTEFLASEFDPVGQVLTHLNVPTSLGKTSVKGLSGVVGGAFGAYITAGEIGGEDYEVMLSSHPYGGGYNNWPISVHGEFPMFAALHRVAGVRTYDPARSWTPRRIHDGSALGALTFPLSANSFGEHYGMDLATDECVFLPASGMLVCPQYFSSPSFPGRKGGTVFTLDLDTGEVTAIYGVPFPLGASPGHANPLAIMVDPTGTLGNEVFGVRFDMGGATVNYLQFFTYDHTAGTIRPLTNFLATGDSGNKLWGHGTFDADGWAYFSTQHGLFAGSLYCWPKSGGTWEFASAPYAWSGDVGVPISSVHKVALTGGFGNAPLRYDSVNKTVLYPGASVVVVPVVKRGTAAAPEFKALPSVNADLNTNTQGTNPGTITPAGTAVDEAARKMFWAIARQSSAADPSYPQAPPTLSSYLLEYALDQIAGTPFRVAATGGNISTVSFTPGLPAWQAGDLVVIAMVSNLRSTDAAIVVNGGDGSWHTDLEDNNGSAGMRYAVFSRIMQAGDSNPVFTNPLARGEVWVALAYSDPDPTTPINAVGITKANTGTTLTAPSVNTTVPRCRILRVFGANLVQAWTPGAGPGKTLRAEKDGISGGIGSVVAYEEDVYQAAAGATGTSVVTDSSSALNGALTIAIAPPQAATPLSKTSPGWTDPTIDALAYFFPANDNASPSRARVAWADRELGGSTPDSASWRRLQASLTGLDVTVGGVTYPGGRWSGPLAQAEIDALTAAGFIDRIVYVTAASELPVGIP